jgi:hypothetical protein
VGAVDAISRKAPWARFFLVLASATVLTALFLFLGTPLLRVLRNVYGSWKYWISGVAVTALMLTVLPSSVIYAFLFFSLWVTTGFYQELEEKGRGNFWTALLSVLIGSSLVIVGPAVVAHALHLDLTALLKESFDQILQQISPGKSLKELGISAEGIVGQLPSMLIVVHIMSLAFALMLDRKMAQVFGLRHEKIASEMKLLEFKVPDVLIWLTMFSFLFSFVNVGPAWTSVVSLNVFNVMMGIYFFQGLAVLEVCFLAFRIGSFFRFLIYLLVVGQLFFLLSLVGVVDYWVDFRRRLRKWRLNERSRNNGENV